MRKKLISVLIVVVTIIIAFLGGQTFSKYITQVKGTGIANVAHWNFKVNNSEDVIQTINLASTVNNDTLVNNKIAPGTSGNFKINIDATDAEVGINYKVEFTNEQNKPTNLKFIYNGLTYNSIKEIEEKLTGTINAQDENKIITISIDWQWPYETGENSQQINSNDKLDTQDGKNIAEYKFDCLVTGIQVMPE